jgi:hypothetical protein
MRETITMTHDYRPPLATNIQGLYSTYTKMWNWTFRNHHKDGDSRSFLHDYFSTVTTNRNQTPLAAWQIGKASEFEWHKETERLLQPGDYHVQYGIVSQVDATGGSGNGMTLVTDSEIELTFEVPE